MAQLIYCAAAAQAEVARAESWQRWDTLNKVTLGLVPVVDGKCPFCNKPVRGVI